VTRVEENRITVASFLVPVETEFHEIPSIEFSMEFHGKFHGKFHEFTERFSPGVTKQTSGHVGQTDQDEKDEGNVTMKGRKDEDETERKKKNLAIAYTLLLLTKVFWFLAFVKTGIGANCQTF
jgi:hypothetical protein